MEESNVNLSKDTNLDKNFESQDFIENDASDYESLDSADEENYKNEQNSDYESDSVKNTEREEGDGEESVPPKKVDDDEDKKNPQYIPKRGTFYEHDDRTLEEGEEETNEKERTTKKAIWIEKKERWGHDRYNENEQVPKSKTELIDIYGYDIRNEDGPPRARRRRRYGRGPNKYTRTWEDEDAYRPTKPTKIISKKTKNGEEEFPPLDPNSNVDESEEEQTETNETDISLAKVVSNGIPKPPEIHPKVEVTTPKQIEKAPVVKVPQPEIKPTDYRGFTKVRQYKNSQIIQQIVKRQEKLKIPDSLEEDIANLSISKKQNRQNSVPPRLQIQHKGSKRYSSLRQRSLPETVASTTFNQQTYYANDYTPPQPQQAILSPPLPPPPQILQAIPAAIQQVAPVTTTALLPTPAQFVPPFPPPPPPFLPPPVPGSAFIAPQPQIINYVPNQPQFAQAPFPGFPHQQFNAVTPPPELNYQCQGGTTYYSPQSQQLGYMPIQRRPKAAIPILPPPPQEPRGRGRTNNGFDGPPPGFDGPPPGFDDYREQENVQEANYEDITNLIVQ